MVVAGIVEALLPFKSLPSAKRLIQQSLHTLSTHSIPLALIIPPSNELPNWHRRYSPDSSLSGVWLTKQVRTLQQVHYTGCSYLL